MPDARMDDQAADLLTAWRLAERDVVAARAVQNIAASALGAAQAAEDAARRAEIAADAVIAAALGARTAAERARKAVRHASEETQLHSASAKGDKARADQALAAAIRAESETHERFRRSQNGGMDDHRWPPTPSTNAPEAEPQPDGPG